VMKTAIGLLTLALAAPAAADPTPLRLTPPKEYDRPYKGIPTLVVARSQQLVRELCPAAKFSSQIGALGCPHIIGNKCWVVLAPDADIKAGFPPELVKRHEIAHCNGWPADHSGALPFVDWAE
jgi:hypothetical protein